jgi:hypothetical protein
MMKQLPSSTATTSLSPTPSVDLSNPIQKIQDYQLSDQNQKLAAASANEVAAKAAIQEKQHHLSEPEVSMGSKQLALCARMPFVSAPQPAIPVAKPAAPPSDFADIVR